MGFLDSFIADRVQVFCLPTLFQDPLTQSMRSEKKHKESWLVDTCKIVFLFLQSGEYRIAYDSKNQFGHTAGHNTGN